MRRAWKRRWASVVETIPTSETALQQAFIREANGLPPCKAQKDTKVGGRDAAIWLSAVEYARTHPDENVYFVSNNTRDFSDGTAYASPMSEDATRPCWCGRCWC
ncbi:PIN domain-containing protein [Streptomyces sp. NPDC002685]|uniref:PIN domain-containing protein n=1 Tax=Streptomyces sp. NPDC002685 TaxID=3154540 RepID=UPI00332CCF98